MKNCLTLLFLFLSTSDGTVVYAQKETLHWFFGEKAGFQFSTGSPTPFTSANWFTNNASAVQSDPASGKLLCYTNSEIIWDAYNTIMPNGTDLAGNSSLSQACLIVPNPADNEQYYLFTLSDHDWPEQRVRTVSLYSSLIDMRLNNRKGDLVVDKKNVLLQRDLSEKLIAIKHRNGQDYWIITHSLNGNIFFVRLLTSDGISDAKQITIGSVYNSNIGCMQASPDGSKIACAVWVSRDAERYSTPFDLFRFDNQTGDLSKYINLGSFTKQYGVCFSPDNSKLYLTHQTVSSDLTQLDYIRQYDLSAGDNEAIIRSGMSVNVNNPDTNIPPVHVNKPNPDQATFYALAVQNALDGRIYGITLGGFCQVEACGQDTHAQRFIVINNPNKKGFNCGIQLKDFPLGAGRINNTQDLPNFIQSSFNNLEPKSILECGAYDVVIYPNPTTVIFYVQYRGDCFRPYTLRLVNTLGQVVQTAIVDSATSNAFSVAQFSAGTYLIEIATEQNKQVIKLIKR